jgi:hypothetical protein
MMKVILFVLGVVLFSVLVYARDLDSMARRERARQKALAESGRANALRFTDDDLDRYRSDGNESRESGHSPRQYRGLERDRAKEREFWEKERLRHERELARLDASIRKLEWRLKERQGRKAHGERLDRDPAAELLSDSLEGLRAERKRLDGEFRERARKAGAFPGWIR